MDIRTIAQDIARRIKPGQYLDVSGNLIGEFAIPARYGGSEPGQQVLDHMVGGSYDMTVEYDSQRGVYRFTRLGQPLEDGRRSSVSDDRRDDFHQNPDGTFSLKSTDAPHDLR